MKFKTFIYESKVGTSFIAYHQTSKENAEDIKKNGFNFKTSLQKIIWFTNDLNSLKNVSTGASRTGAILKLQVTIKKAADWYLYEDKTLDELQQLGYDGVILENKDKTFDGFVFSKRQIKLLDVLKSHEEINEAPLNIDDEYLMSRTNENAMDYEYKKILSGYNFYKYAKNINGLDYKLYKSKPSIHIEKLALTITDSDDKCVGFIKMNPGNIFKNSVNISLIKISKNRQLEGIASTAYKILLEHFDYIISDDLLTDG